MDQHSKVDDELTQVRCNPVFHYMETFVKRKKSLVKIKKWSNLWWQHYAWFQNQNSCLLSSQSHVSLRNKLQESAISFCLAEKKLNNLYVEVDHPSKSIISTMFEVIAIQVTCTLKPCYDCALGKSISGSKEKGCYLIRNVGREALTSMLLQLLFFCSKKHWLLVVDVSSDFVWVSFEREVWSSKHYNKLN